MSGASVSLRENMKGRVSGDAQIGGTAGEVEGEEGGWGQNERVL